MRRFLIALLFVFQSNAGIVEDFAQDYKDGKAFADEPYWAWEYQYTTDRSITFGPQVLDPDAIIATYEKRRTLDGVEEIERGIAALYVRDGKVYHLERSPTEGVDLALTGQMADIGTTAAGMAAGFAEANPVIAGAGPVGLAAIIGLKMWASQSMNDLPLLSCIGEKQSVSQIGWSLSAWNLGALLIHPAAGLAMAAIAMTYADDRQAAFRACALAKLDTRIS